MLQNLTDNQAILQQTENLFPEVMLALMVAIGVLFYFREKRKETLN